MARDGLRLSGCPAQGPRPGQGPAEGVALADHAAGLEERGVLPRSRPRGLAEVDAFPGDAEFSAGNQPMTLLLPRRQPPTAAPCARREGHRQRAAARPVPPGRRPPGGPGRWEPEAVQAQAVAARTYAAYERAHRDVALPDLRHRLLPGLRRRRGRAPGRHRRDAGDRGRVVLYDGEPAFTQFSSSNGGWTSAGSRPTWSPSRTPTTAGRGTRTTRGRTVSGGTDREGVPGSATCDRILHGRDGHGRSGAAGSTR